MRLRNIWHRIYQYFGVYFFQQGGLAFNWRYHGRKSFLPYRTHFDTRGNPTGQVETDFFDQLVDFFDQLVDFIRDQFHLLRMFIREEMCTHPANQVYHKPIYEPGYGDLSETVCGRCGGYISDDMVERYSKK